MDSEVEIFNKIMDLGLVHTAFNCNKANCKKIGQQMKLSTRKRSKDAKNVLLAWRCSSCGTFKSAMDGSFFALFKKPLRIILAIFKCWCAELTISKTVTMMNLNFDHKINRETVSSIFFRLRQLCSLALSKQNFQIGGANKII